MDPHVTLTDTIETFLKTTDTSLTSGSLGWGYEAPAVKIDMVMESEGQTQEVSLIAARPGGNHINDKVLTMVSVNGGEYVRTAYHDSAWYGSGIDSALRRVTIPRKGPMTVNIKPAVRGSVVIDLRKSPTFSDYRQHVVSFKSL